MSACPQCGRENAASASICGGCHAALDPGSAPAPRLLAQIQGLIPAEPIISTGRLREDEPEGGVEGLATGLPAAKGATEVRAEEEGRAPAPAVASEVAGEGESERSDPIPPSAEEQPMRGRHPVWIPAFEAEPETEAIVEPPVAVAAAVAEAETEDKDDRKYPIVLAKPAPLALRRDIKSSRPLWIIALVLVATILLASLFSSNESAPAPRRPAVESTYTYIELLPNRPRVLLAWDFEPTTQGEMGLLAQPIVSHLRLKRARIANVSLRPTGPAVAAAVIALVDEKLPLGAAAAQPPTVELGFIPGDAAALRALSQNPADTANLPEYSARDGGLDADETLEAFDLIIEFSAETAASREWIEQIASRQDTPMIIAASGAVAPTLRPYEQTGQIVALLSGYPDALAYEQILGQDGPAAKQQSAQTWLSLLLVVLVIVLLIRSARKP